MRRVLCHPALRRLSKRLKVFDELRHGVSRLTLLFHIIIGLLSADGPPLVGGWVRWDQVPQRKANKYFLSTGPEPPLLPLCEYEYVSFIRSLSDPFKPFSWRLFITTMHNFISYIRLRSFQHFSACWKQCECHPAHWIKAKQKLQKHSVFQFWWF